MAERNDQGFKNIVLTLQHRGFFYYTLGSLTSQIGSWTYRVAAGWLMWELTYSPTWLGILGFANQFSAVISPVAGALADRMDRLMLTRVSQFLLFLQGLALAAMTYAGLTTPLSLALLALIQGVLQSIDQPARYSLYPTLIAPENLTTAVALDSITFNTARLVGPVIAGYLIVNQGIELAFVVNAASFAVFCLCLCIVKAPPMPSKPGRKSDLMGDMRDGIRYGLRHPGIGPTLLLLTMSTVLAMPLQHLLPGYSSEVFGMGAVGFSWLTACMGLGAMIGAFWLARKGSHFGLTAVLVRTFLVAGLSMFLLTATDIFYVGLVAVAFAGSCSTLSRGTSQTLIQNAVDGAMRGRVISIFGMIFRVGPAIGALVMGATAEAFGFQVPLITAGVLLILAWWWANRQAPAMAAVLEVDAKDRLH